MSVSGNKLSVSSIHPSAWRSWIDFSKTPASVDEAEFKGCALLRADSLTTLPNSIKTLTFIDAWISEPTVKKVLRHIFLDPVTWGKAKPRKKVDH